MFPTYKNSQKQVKNQKSTDKHSPFDGLVQEDISLAVLKPPNYKMTTNPDF